MATNKPTPAQAQDAARKATLAKKIAADAKATQEAVARKTANKAKIDALKAEEKARLARQAAQNAQAVKDALAAKAIRLAKEAALRKK